MNEKQRLIDEIWKYLVPRTDIEALISEDIDVIFVFGGIGDEIPIHAAKLYSRNISKIVLITGKSGALTKTHYKKDEHEEFYDLLINNGVDSKSIIVEPLATNAGENVTFGIRSLLEEGIRTEKLVLVCRSFMMRRALLTFEKQFPNIICFPSPPEVEMTGLIMKNSTLEIRLIEEIKRLIDYFDQGFIANPNIPDYIIENTNRLKQLL